MNFTFYILYSSLADRYYIGHSSEAMEERLRKHNSNHKGFTGKFDDWEVFYTEVFETKREAYQRELQVKKWKSRKRMEKLSCSSAKLPHRIRVNRTAFDRANLNP